MTAEPPGARHLPDSSAVHAPAKSRGACPARRGGQRAARRTSASAASGSAGALLILAVLPRHFALPHLSPAQHVANTAHCLQQARRAIVQLLPQMADEDLEYVVAPVVIVPPDVREDDFAGQHLARMHQEEFEQLELFLMHPRSEEHTAELQSLTNLVCLLLLGKKRDIATARRSLPYTQLSSHTTVV